VRNRSSRSATRGTDNSDRDRSENNRDGGGGVWRRQPAEGNVGSERCTAPLLPHPDMENCYEIVVVLSATPTGALLKLSANNRALLNIVDDLQEILT
jgi:hypothetical protein